jgi:hypothetical protein
MHTCMSTGAKNSRRGAKLNKFMHCHSLAGANDRERDFRERNENEPGKRVDDDKIARKVAFGDNVTGERGELIEYLASFCALCFIFSVN